MGDPTLVSRHLRTKMAKPSSVCKFSLTSLPGRPKPNGEVLQIEQLNMTINRNNPRVPEPSSFLRPLGSVSKRKTYEN